MSKDSFYSPGLQFECTLCSRCCRFEPGYVFISRNDLDRLASYLSINRGNFVKKYCRKINLGFKAYLSLKEKKNYDCIFWEGYGCSIYEARPLQCRSYPFWRNHLVDARSWNLLQNECPGINRGVRYSMEYIDYWLNREKSEDYDIIPEIEEFLD